MDLRRPLDLLLGRGRTRLTYGDHPSQHADLWLPRHGGGAGGPDDNGRWPVVVVIHGGFWRTRYGRTLGTPLARDLVGRGVAALNIEYRRVGDDPKAGGGGWPRTCEDVAAAVDLLAGDRVRELTGDRLDLDRVVALGHSAGGHLAGWLAARPHFPAGLPGAEPRVRLSGFVSQAGVLDLEHAAAQDLGAGATQAMIGGEPAAFPDAYRAASPIRWPITTPFACVHGTADDVVPIDQSERYLEASVGSDGEPLGSLIRLEGVGHQELIVPFHRAWHASRAATLELLGLG
ncbi:acetyl esterase/lipase [Friedmanniella endophytica]|uniref:Acetyl esterase/lipase n=1 Tax=Microlunatus kandeliicorticis TaxID=1759536 RepID=A0A7W3P435_9ACTN|nr:alpha/beta hydrolase [Microlunatus kandeliicorticis]MBA8792450.1 acetyl esterase/lipase [Microlunatus kandeliicorticis]